MMMMSTPWIDWFCSLRGNRIFAKVEAEFINDAFNLFGLKPKFKDYNAALDMILGDEVPPANLANVSDEYRELINQAIELYGLIHARFILTQAGLSIMASKYKAGQFGVCPRILCRKHHVLPIGISEELREFRCRVYCPNCQEVYIPRGELAMMQLEDDVEDDEDQDGDAQDDDDDDEDDSMQQLGDRLSNPYHNDPFSQRNVQIYIDGAFFGTTFPHMLLISYPRFLSPTIPIPHIPQLYGFNQHGAKSVIMLKIDNGEYGEYARSQMGSHNDAKYKQR